MEKNFVSETVFALAQKYVAIKMAFRDLNYKAAQKAMKEDVYLDYTMRASITEMPPILKTELEEALRRRFGLEEHKPVFMRPTVKQWISDIFGHYTAQDILAAMAQASGVASMILSTKTIDDATLNRPLLIDMVVGLENATGRKLLKNDDLAHLPKNYGYTDLAEFFATAE